jgi:cell wall-associated NlpC family hydrolase
MFRATFIAAALTFLHNWYKWGGDDTQDGIDCSGLAQELLAIVGLDPEGDQTAQALHDHFAQTGKGIEGVLGTGSLAFYGKSKKEITHVAMILEGETIIEAGGGGSKNTTKEISLATNARVRLRPLRRRKDLVAVIEPVGLPWTNGEIVDG